MDRWGIPFHVIEREWTDTQFFLMVDKLGERLERENKQNSKSDKHSPSPSKRGGTVETRTYSQKEAQAIGAEQRRS